MTLEEISGRIGLTRERVHQIEKAALAELAATLERA
jgi:DNA-directed RNA polymerase sigma subunit (sigma70/sigma32)